ncbi:MAG TPA: phosphatidylglycerophosphatase A [Candidatus Eisenbacteria bacterium]
MRRLALIVATGFGLGRLPVAPATWASAAVALLLFLLPAPFLAPAPLGVAIVAVTAIGVWASHQAEKDLGRDAHPIVIDEVVGMLIAVWSIPAGSVPRNPFLLLGAAFLLFRVLDVVKPFPIRQSQRLPGGWGVVVDDVLAGLATNLILRFAVRAGAPF